MERKAISRNYMENYSQFNRKGCSDSSHRKEAYDELREINIEDKLSLLEPLFKTKILYRIKLE